ncbi:hypothetical protein [Nocardia flavorosea]|uniref:Uncharacterized protein n=1 Tax=Nocardia flavorosea TaxID=53429 RepID=A0A846YR05_9NOCA|nr:hypothetical protein [Nocardia flavorosea]NKY59818.1 hypothetical protein [Nocardia flavorosea]
MTDAGVAEDNEVSVVDAVSWLQEEGLARLAALGEATGPAAAFTVDVNSGLVIMFPATNKDSSSCGADELPAPIETTGRLVTVGVTTSAALLVVDLSGSLMIAVNGDRPELATRFWALQLLLNPDITLTTNSGEVAIGSSSRCKKSFIPGGGGAIISVDDGRPPVTTVSMNSAMDGADYLELAPDGSGEMYLGPRFWQLDHVLTIADEPWSALASALEGADR